MGWWRVCRWGLLPAHRYLWRLGGVLMNIASQARWMHLRILFLVRTFFQGLLLLGRVWRNMDVANSMPGGLCRFFTIIINWAIKQKLKLIMIVLSIYESAMVFYHVHIKDAYLMSCALPCGGLSRYPMICHMYVYTDVRSVLLIAVMTLQLLGVDTFGCIRWIYFQKKVSF